MHHSAPPHHLWHPGPNVINLRRGNCPHPELTASLTSLLPLPVVNASGCGPLITACLTSPLFTLLLTARKHIKTQFSSQSGRCVNKLSECRAAPDTTCKMLWYHIKMIYVYVLIREHLHHCELDIFKNIIPTISYFWSIFILFTSRLWIRTWLSAPWGDAGPWACDIWTPSWWKRPRWLNLATPGSAGR